MVFTSGTPAVHSQQLPLEKWNSNITEESPLAHRTGWKGTHGQEGPPIMSTISSSVFLASSLTSKTLNPTLYSISRNKLYIRQLLRWWNESTQQTTRAPAGPPWTLVSLLPPQPLLLRTHVAGGLISTWDSARTTLDPLASPNPNQRFPNTYPWTSVASKPH